MAAGNFNKCLVRILVYEGGNDDDPRDPGGRTSRGILQSEYDRYLKRTGRWAILADRDVWKASTEDICAIYRANYWDRAMCEDLPEGVDITIFDGAVNSGVSQCAKWAQRATGIIVDGDFGPATRQALQTANDNDVLCADILGRRMAMLKSLKTWGDFGRGWSARIANVLKIAQAWASGSIGPNPVKVDDIGGNRKAFASGIKQPMISAEATRIAQGASTTGTLAGSAASQIQPVASMFPERIGMWVLGIAGTLTVIAIVANQIATAAQRRADRAKSAEAKAEIDATADEASPPVAVNDNAAPDPKPEAA